MRAAVSRVPAIKTIAKREKKTPSSSSGKRSVFGGSGVDGGVVGAEGNTKKSSGESISRRPGTRICFARRSNNNTAAGEIKAIRDLYSSPPREPYKSDE